MLTGGPAADPGGGFSRLDLSARRCVVAAVSGGSDSLALLLLLQTHLRQTGSPEKLLAVTVDHGLRPEATTEAARVAGFCAARGIAHSTRRWEGEKPRMGVSAAAREARYRLLAEAARDHGGDLVLTGHTEDDQAETVLMRKRRGDGPGLAGMAPATLFQGNVWICRPLLGESRTSLRAFLRRQGVDWIDDPSNADSAYERVRARRELASSDDDKQALLAEAADAAAPRIALGSQAAAIIRSATRCVAPGLVRLDPDLVRAADPPALVQALRLLLAALGGREHLPEADVVAALVAALRRPPAAKPLRIAIAGTILDARKSGTFLHREFRGAGPAPIPAADGAVWDGRFCIGLSGPATDCLTIGACGRDVELCSASDHIPHSLLRAAFATEPAVLQAPHPAAATFSPLAGRRRTAATPATPSPRPLRGEGKGEGQFLGAGSATLTPLVAPYARFLPSFDLAPAQAVAELLGAPSFPPPPFCRRDEQPSS